MADRQRLLQVLLNLLSNAVKYNREGGSVEVSCDSAVEGRLRIVVRDTGPGILPDELGQLFTPFERLGAEQSGVEGTGLGLSLSKRLIEAMNGTIGVESVPDQGSAFWIELPIAEGQVEESKRVGTDLLASPEWYAKAYTMLYIEDNLSNLALMERLLQQRPHINLLPTMQGQLGLEMARELRPDLILLDLHLPDIKGDAVLQQLQDDPSTSHIPVVMLSADATQRQIDRLLAAGAWAYLTKPIDVKRLLEILDEALDARLQS